MPGRETRGTPVDHAGDEAAQVLHVVADVLDHVLGRVECLGRVGLAARDLALVLQLLTNSLLGSQIAQSAITFTPL